MVGPVPIFKPDIVNQEYVVAPEAVMVALLPKQIVGLFGEKFSGAFTVTATVELLEHPLTSTPISE
jgi:hypothetical protein